MELVPNSVNRWRKRHPVGHLAGGHLLFANEKCASVGSSLLSIVGRKRPHRQRCQAHRLEAIEEEGEPLTRAHPHGCDDGDERNDGERFENDSPHEKGYHIAAARRRAGWIVSYGDNARNL